MILLNVLPSSYHPLVSTIIQTTTGADFTLDKTIPKVISEAQLRFTSQINHCALMHRLFTSGLDRSEANQTNTFSMLPLNLSVHTVARDICPTIAGRCMGIQDSRTLNLRIILTKVINPSDLTDLWTIPVCIITGMRVIASILEITRKKGSLMQYG